MSEDAQRARVIAAARGWLGTPYHHRARVKGAGVDCAQILIAAFSEAGVIEAFDTGEYPPDWHLHRSEERYIGFIERFAGEIELEQLQAADVVVWRYGRTFSHGGIVTRVEPLSVIHAFAPYGFVDESAVAGMDMAGREMRAFSLWRGT